ncbi:flavin reductase family protein [Oceanibacterium hippocampi]|nr:flavin reductase family protein [Oceanibacterium hippocampi]
MPAKSVNASAFREAMGRFVTGVTVVTAMTAEAGPVGITVNSFNSVSLDPPLVLFSIDRLSQQFGPLIRARRYAVNVLGREQEVLSRIFSLPQADRWNGVGYSETSAGSPYFPEALACFDCEAFAQHDGGDHVIFIGRVVDVIVGDPAEPLVYYRGRYNRLESA